MVCEAERPQVAKADPRTVPAKKADPSKSVGPSLGEDPAAGTKKNPSPPAYGHGFAGNNKKTAMMNRQEHIRPDPDKQPAG